jgi:hypothetical protein
MSIVWNTGRAAERARFNLKLKNKKRKKRQASSSQASSFKLSSFKLRPQLESRIKK